MEPEKNIRFETKEEACERRMREALNCSPHERLMFFLEMAGKMQFFKTSKSHPNRVKNNFVIE